MFVTYQSCLTLCDPMYCSHQAPLSVGFSRPGHWSGLPCPLPGCLPNQVWNLGLLYCRQTLYHLSQHLQFWLLPSSPTPCCGASTINPAAMPEATTLAVGNSEASVTLKAWAAARRALATCLEEALEGVKCWFSNLWEAAQIGEIKKLVL